MGRITGSLDECDDTGDERDNADDECDDDTYVILENLRFLLSDYNSSDPIWFGCEFDVIVKEGYMSGGAGYVLSKGYLTVHFSSHIYLSFSDQNL